jgi:hypothetical protein
MDSFFYKCLFIEAAFFRGRKWKKGILRRKKISRKLASITRKID